MVIETKVVIGRFKLELKMGCKNLYSPARCGVLLFLLLFLLLFACLLISLALAVCDCVLW